MSSIDFGLITLIDEGGRKYLVKTGRGMQEVVGLGVVDTDKLAQSQGNVVIAGKEYNVLPTSLQDILANIRRGPQWIMPKDAVQIVFNCGIGPGKKVLEIGTGTGALTIVMASCVGAEGKITSYEINEKHGSLARKNIELAGFSGRVELIIADGSTCKAESEYDAVTTDMPEPWTILEMAKKALRPGGFICTYLPTMNQVEQSVKAMREAGFIETHVQENIQREIVVGKGGTRPSFEMLGHTGYLCFGRKV